MATTIFTIHRTVPGASLLVNLNISGTAVRGVDYNFTTGVTNVSGNNLQVTIPPGQLTTSVTLDTEGAVLSVDKTVTLSVVDTTNYVGIFPDTQTVTIKSSPVGDIIDQMSAPPILAFSLSRRLRSTYTGAAFKVRRSSDNQTQDIGYLSDGSVDTGALTSFVGVGDGYVVDIYNNAPTFTTSKISQSTPANQPLIVEAGVVVRRHGRVCMRQSQSPATWMLIPTSTTVGTGNVPYTINYVGGHRNAVSVNARVLGSVNNDYSLGYHSTAATKSFASPGNDPLVVGAPQNGNFTLRSYTVSTNIPVTTIKLFEDNYEFRSSGGLGALSSGNLSTNGNGNGGSGTMSDCFFAEFVAWSTGQTVQPQFSTLISSQISWYELENVDTHALYNFNEANGNTTFVDRSLYAGSITRRGGAIISSTAPQYGSGCLLLPTTNSGLYSGGQQFFVSAGEEFSIELAISPDISLASGTFNLFTENDLTVGHTNGGLKIINSKISWMTPGSGALLLESPVISFPIGSYTNISVTRKLNTLSLRLNGVAVAQLAGYSSSIPFQQNWQLGYGNYVGRIDEFRFTRGREITAPRTGEFKVPVPL